MSTNLPKNAGRQRVKGETLLEIRDLRIEGESSDVWHPIVKGIDLTLKAGEVLGLVGESGAGKSTLGLAAMGYVRPGCRFVSGSVVFDGLDLLKTSEAARRAIMGSRIAYVAQSAAASFNPAHKIIDQTVETAVDHRIMPRDDAEDDARNLFRMLKLPQPDSIGERYPHQVSGGQLQRAMTAMAMSCRPELIIFDEPTTALDVITSRQILDLFLDLQAETGVASLYISHDLALLSRTAKRVAVIRRGEIVEQGAVDAIFNAPQHDYTRQLIAAVPRPSDRLTQTRPSYQDQPLMTVENVSVHYGRKPFLSALTGRSFERF
ncbi:MAG: ABC transporter ATP-binding protein, partial [Mesorhizobium sp.]